MRSGSWRERRDATCSFGGERGSERWRLVLVAMLPSMVAWRCGGDGSGGVACGDVEESSTRAGHREKGIGREGDRRPIGSDGIRESGEETRVFVGLGL